eukprot:14004746-Heterocapsa_arctica.AAC.1
MFMAMSTPHRLARAALRPGLNGEPGSICPLGPVVTRDGVSVITEETSSSLLGGEGGGVERVDRISVLPSDERRVP